MTREEKFVIDEVWTSMQSLSKLDDNGKRYFDYSDVKKHINGLKWAKGEKHIFSPQPNDDDWCKYCNRNIRNEIHSSK